MNKQVYCKALKEEFYIENEVVCFSLTNGRSFKVFFSYEDKDYGKINENKSDKSLILKGPHNKFSQRYFIEWAENRRNLSKLIYILDESSKKETQTPFYVGVVKKIFAA